MRPLSSAGAISAGRSGSVSSRTPGASSPSRAISAGRKRPSPMSLMWMRKVLREAAGSKRSGSLSASSSVPSADCTATASRSARGVGATPPGARVNSASFSSSRSRPSPWLAAGCVRPERIGRAAHAARAIDGVEQAQQVQVDGVDMHGIHVA